MNTLLMLLACAKPGTTTKPPEDLGPPVVPAVVAPVYTTAPGAPRDPLIAWAARDLPYDEALAGAAAGVAFEMLATGGGLDPSGLRWAAVRAGWPWPVQGVSSELVSEGELPAAMVSELRAALKPGQAIGLARVRDDLGSGDLWVGLTSTPALALAPIRREQAVGATLTLGVKVDSPAPAGLRVLAASPSLRLIDGPSVTLDEPGEWVIELRQAQDGGGERALAQLPIYVGEPTPDDGPFEAPDAPPADVGEAIRGAIAGVNGLRGLSAAQTLSTDPVLAATARSEATRRAAGGGPSADAEARLRRAGFPTGDVAELSCRAPTVQSCLDGLFWSPTSRAALLDPDMTLLGVGAELTNGQLTLVLGMAAGS
ncbi:MAG: hypothetical protein IPI35_17895 [Deltaproteobacteria bacterium]|nr:hypothetical protein [Deltaproteobacteria bacterium]